MLNQPGNIRVVQLLHDLHLALQVAEVHAILLDLLDGDNGTRLAVRGAVYLRREGSAAVAPGKGQAETRGAASRIAGNAWTTAAPTRKSRFRAWIEAHTCESLSASGPAGPTLRRVGELWAAGEPGWLPCRVMLLHLSQA